MKLDGGASRRHFFRRQFLHEHCSEAVISTAV